MTLENLSGILEETGYPVAYKSFPTSEKVKYPHICYESPESNNFFADGIVYYSSMRIAVFLYTKNKNPAAETRLENIFDSHGLPWIKDAYYNDKQKCYEIDYEIEV